MACTSWELELEALPGSDDGSLHGVHRSAVRHLARRPVARRRVGVPLRQVLRLPDMARHRGPLGRSLQVHPVSRGLPLDRPRAVLRPASSPDHRSHQVFLDALPRQRPLEVLPDPNVHRARPNPGYRGVPCRRCCAGHPGQPADHRDHPDRSGTGASPDLQNRHRSWLSLYSTGMENRNDQRGRPSAQSRHPNVRLLAHRLPVL